MSWQIKLSPKARLDIEQVLDWTLEQFGPIQHAAYLALIRSALDEMASDPTGSRATHRPELRANVWVFHITRRGHRARHLFVYRISETNTIDVARFLHDSMDLIRHLPPDYAAEPSDD